jgi:hypothetical protein
MRRFDIRDPLIESTPSQNRRGRILAAHRNSRAYESSLCSATGLPRFGKGYQSRKETRDCVFRHSSGQKHAHSCGKPCFRNIQPHNHDPVAVGLSVYTEFNVVQNPGRGLNFMLAQLIPKQGGAPITLTRAITVVGRSSKLCDLVIDHTNVSKQHCILVKTDGLLYLRDLGSTNGTRVNGQRVLRGALLPGDQLSLSGISYRVHLGPDSPLPGKISPIQPTEMIPLIDDGGLNDENMRMSQKPNDDASKSDVRFLRDSDLLIPD